jgi:DNA relaxase NicK
MKTMLQIKEGKSKYRNTFIKRKAAFRGSGFLNSKTYEKSMNLTIKIIRQNEKHYTRFFNKPKRLEENLRGAKE